jgi:hypothetical protein
MPSFAVVHQGGQGHTENVVRDGIEGVQVLRGIDMRVLLPRFFATQHGMSCPPIPLSLKRKNR